jgi:ubiquinone/menaquinone biosynthesis C-methylase UbiE
MTRTPEPELMTDEDQASAYAAADLSEVNEPVANFFRGRFPALAEGARLLDIGCGTADLTIRLVRSYPGIMGLGVDGSEAMLASGRDLVERAGLQSRIRLERRMFPDAALDAGGFGAVTANSLLHHLSDTSAFWPAAQRCALPGAPVLVADLRRPPDAAAVEALVERYAWRALPLLRRDFRNSLHAGYTVEEVRGQLRESGVRGFTVEESGPLHLVVWGYGA